MATVVLLGTFDTKGDEYAWLRDRLREEGCETLLIDAGVFSDGHGIADVLPAEVAAAGGVDEQGLAPFLTQPVAQPCVLVPLRVEGPEENYCCHRSSAFPSECRPVDCRVRASAYVRRRVRAHARWTQVDRSARKGVS